MDSPISAIKNVTEQVPLHPYWPLNTHMPNYAANSMSMGVLLAIFFSGCTAIFATTHVLIKQARPDLSRGEAWTAMWFVLCGFIHLFFEGYFSINSLDMVSQTDLFGQLWKEYALSDSRYLSQDAFVVCMETVTAFFWGPLSFVCAWCIVKDHPLRHPLQMIISLGQFYGDVLYYATCHWSRHVFETIYCRPEDFYFWAYYVLCNAFWIVIPFKLLISSVIATKRAFALAQATDKSRKSL